MRLQHWTGALLASSLALGACSSQSETPGNAASGPDSTANLDPSNPGGSSSSGSSSSGASSGGGGSGSSSSSTGSSSSSTGSSSSSTGSSSSSTGSSSSSSSSSSSGVVVSQKAEMPLISAGRPALASHAQSPALDAVDSTYDTAWRTAHVPNAVDPDWLAIDLSSVPPVQRTTVYSVWFNENGYNYDTSDGSSYTLPGDFEIQANSAPGGGQAPANGWVTLASTTGNLLSSGATLLSLGGYEWVRFHCTASAANVAPQNTDLSLQWNLYDAHLGNDGWKFGGDSITANSMGHQKTDDSFDQLVHGQLANQPAFEMAGHGGWSTATLLGSIDAFLANFPGLYFGIALGTNDAPGNDPQSYHDNMVKLIDKVIAAGKTPVVPTIPYTGDPSHSPIPAYNARIQALYAQYGAALVHGPDLYTVIYDGRVTMFDNPTDLHPNAAGNAAIRKAWADAMVKNVYGG